MGEMKNLIKYSIYPAYVLGAMVTYFVLIPHCSTEILQKTLLLSLSSFFFILILAHEKLSPHRQEWTKSFNDEFSDGLQTLIVFPVTIEIIYQGLKFLLGSPLKNFWPPDLPFFVQLILLLVVSEWGHYWYHRTSHRKKWLWKFHAVHHGAHRVYTLNSARFHIVDLVLNMIVYMIPLAVFGISQEVYLSFILINSVTGLLEHANISFDAGPLNYVFNTAQLHRWHHSEKAKESQKNFGKVLCIWDVVHGTHLINSGKEVIQVGIGKRGIVPADYIGQMKYPFQEAKPLATETADVVN